MKLLTSLLGSLALAALLLPAHAQTQPVAQAKAGSDKAAIRQRTADQRAATYKGPKVVKNSEQLGREFIHDSKPSQQPVSPVKQ